MQVTDPYIDDNSTNDPYNFSNDKWNIYLGNARKVQENSTPKTPTYTNWQPDMYTQSMYPSRIPSDEEANEVASRILGILQDSGTGKGLSSEYRFGVDMIMAMALNKPYNEVASNHDLYMMSFIGEKVEDKSFIEAFVNSAKIDDLSGKIARLQNRFDVTEDEDERKRLESEIENLETEIIKLGDYTDRGWMKNQLVKSSPILWQVTKSAMIAAGTGVAGQVIGAAANMAQGLGNSGKAISSFIKAYRTAETAIKAGKIGRKVGAGINILNTFNRESGSLSRELYSMTDENGNRMSDSTRMVAKNIYGLLATAVEYFTPEPSLDRFIKGKAGQSALKSAFMKATKGNLVLNYIESSLTGAVGESLEEGIQQIMSSMSIDLAKAYSDSTGITSFGNKPVSEMFLDAFMDGIDAFGEAFIPSLLAGAIPNAATSVQEWSQYRISHSGDGLTNNSSTRPKVRLNSDVENTIKARKDYIPESDKSVSDLRRSAQVHQDFDAGTDIIDINNLEIKSERPTKDYFSTTDENGSGKIGVINVMPSDRVQNQWVGVTEQDRDMIKALYNKGAQGVAVIKNMNIDTTISDSDFGVLVDNMNGYLTDTEVHFNTEEDFNTFLKANEDILSFNEKNRTISFKSDNGKNVSLNVEIDSSNINTDSQETIATTLSKDASAIASDIMRASEGLNITQNEANLLGELISSIPSLKTSNIVKDSDVGMSLADENAMGASDVESARIILSEDSAPITVIHEGSHLMIRMDPEARMELKKATYKSMINTSERQKLQTFVKQNLELYHGKSLDEIMEVFKSIDNKTDTLTTEQEEVLIDTHSGFVISNSGKFLPEAIRNIFNKLASSFRKIYKNVTGKALLPTNMEKAYSRFYRQENNISASNDANTSQQHSNMNDSNIRYQKLLNSEMLKNTKKRLKDFTSEELVLLIENNVYVPERYLENYVGTKEIDIELGDRKTISNIVTESDKETALLSPNLRSFIEKMKAEKETDWSDNMERLYTKYYIYSKTLTPSEMRRQFIKEHKTIDQLLALKQAITKRKVFYKTKDGKLASRIYVPMTGYTYSQIANLTKDSPEAVINNIIKSIEKDTDVWIKSYIRATADYQRLSAMTVGGEAWLRSMAQIGYLALSDSSFGYLETLRLANSTSDKEFASDVKSMFNDERNLDDMSFAQDYSSEAVEGERQAFDMMIEQKDQHLYEELARSNERREQEIKRIKAEYEEDMRLLKVKKDQQKWDLNEKWKKKYKDKAYVDNLDKTLALKEQKEKWEKKYSDRVFIDRWNKMLSERELRALYSRRIERLKTKILESKMRAKLNFNIDQYDASLIEVTSYIYDAMHDSEKKSGYSITESDYESKMTQKGTVDDSPENTLIFSQVAFNAEGEQFEKQAEMQLGETRYDRKNIPVSLSTYLEEETIQELQDTSKKWSDISYNAKLDIARALNIARKDARETREHSKAVDALRRQQASIDTATSILKSTPDLDEDTLKYIAGKLGVDVDSQEFSSVDFLKRAQRYYIKNRGMIDVKKINPIWDMLQKASLFFGHFQRFARYLDGNKEGAIYKHFVLDVQKSLDNKARNIERRNSSADEEISRILSDGSGKEHGRGKNKQYKADKGKLNWLKSEVEVKSNAMGSPTKKLTGYQLIGAYMYSKNIHGFIKLLSSSGNSISLESLAKINPEYTLRFINEDLKQRAEFDEIEEERRLRAEKRGVEYKRQNHRSILYTENIDLLERIKSQIENGSIKQELPSFAIELGDTLIDLLSKETERLEKSAYELYNMPFKMQENYVPLYSMYGKYRTRDVNSSDKGSHTVFKGMLQDRQLNRDYALMLDPFSVYRTAVDEQETMINMGGIVGDLNYLMDEKGGNLKQIVSDQFGAKFAKVLESQIDVLAGRRETLVGYEGLMNLMIANASVSALGFNLMTPPKQLFSLITTATHGEINLIEICETIGKYWSDMDRFNEIYRTYAPDIASSTISIDFKIARDANSIKKYGSNYAKFLDKSMRWIEKSDQFAKKIAWMAAFDKNIKNKMSETDAAVKATQLIKETQSVSNADSLSSTERSKNPFTRGLLAFSRDTFQFWNILTYDIYSDLKNKKIGKLVEKFLGAFTVGVALALMRGGWIPDDDDDNKFDWDQFKLDLMSQALDYVPIISLTTGLKEGFDGWDSNLITIPEEVGKLIRMPLSKTDYNAEDYIDQMIDIALSGAALTGAPVTAGKRVYNTFLSNGLEEGIGFNPGYLFGTAWGNSNFLNLLE